MARNPKRINVARAFRRKDVPAEKILWRALRNRALGGYKFRRQHPIAQLVVDFACVECKLVVEVDGASHLGSEEEDQKRTEALETEGWLVQRFWSTEIYDELEAVREAIYRLCVQRSSESPSQKRAERGKREG